MHFALHAPRRSRHPITRALSVVVGLAVVGILMLFGLMVAGVLLVGGVLLLALRQWKHAGLPRRPQARGKVDPQVIEGEFVVLNPHPHDVRQV